MTYDMKMKFDIVARYEAGGVSLRSLSGELGIPCSTIFGWIQKSRMAEPSPDAAKLQLPLVDVTGEIKSAPRGISASPITISINGVEMSTDRLGIKAIIEAIRR